MSKLNPLSGVICIASLFAFLFFLGLPDHLFSGFELVSRTYISRLLGGLFLFVLGLTFVAGLSVIFVQKYEPDFYNTCALIGIMVSGILFALTYGNGLYVKRDLNGFEYKYLTQKTESFSWSDVESATVSLERIKSSKHKRVPQLTYELHMENNKVFKITVSGKNLNSEVEMMESILTQLKKEQAEVTYLEVSDVAEKEAEKDLDKNDLMVLKNIIKF